MESRSHRHSIAPSSSADILSPPSNAHNISPVNAGVLRPEKQFVSRPLLREIGVDPHPPPSDRSACPAPSAGKNHTQPSTGGTYPATRRPWTIVTEVERPRPGSRDVLGSTSAEGGPWAASRGFDPFSTWGRGMRIHTCICESNVVNEGGVAVNVKNERGSSTAGRQGGDPSNAAKAPVLARGPWHAGGIYHPPQTVGTKPGLLAAYGRPQVEVGGVEHREEGGMCHQPTTTEGRGPSTAHRGVEPSTAWTGDVYASAGSAYGLWAAGTSIVDEMSAPTVAVRGRVVNGRYVPGHVGNGRGPWAARREFENPAARGRHALHGRERGPSNFDTGVGFSIAERRFVPTTSGNESLYDRSWQGRYALSRPRVARGSPYINNLSSRHFDFPA